MKKSIKVTVLATMIGSSSLMADSAPVYVGHLAGSNSNVGAQQLVTGAQATPNAPSPTLSLVEQMQAMQEQMRQMQGQLELQAHQMAQLQNSLSGVAPSVAMPATNAAPTSAANAAIAPPVVAIPGNATATAAPAPTMDANQAKAVLNEEQEYQQAYQALLSKQYEPARAGMQSYLQKYPQGSFAGNAHYWLGELDLISGDSAQALAQFTAVVEKFPDTAKAPDSMLKIGLIYADEQQYSKASKQLHNVVSRYPNSSTAELAKQRLTLMQKQGNLNPADA